jgi:hypothetical protein
MGNHFRSGPAGRKKAECRVQNVEHVGGTEERGYFHESADYVDAHGVPFWIQMDLQSLHSFVVEVHHSQRQVGADREV